LECCQCHCRRARRGLAADIGGREILIVDNASTDGTAELAYPEIVTVVRNQLNLGISSAVKTGLEYARAHGYDWLWVLDADSRPRPDALELLTHLVEAGGQDVGIVGPSHNLLNLGRILRGRVLSPVNGDTPGPQPRPLVGCGSSAPMRPRIGGASAFDRRTC
jgi:glycosyltransferase involved in cell wall biosynthesis